MSNTLVAREGFARVAKEEKAVESGLLRSTFVGAALGFAAGAANGAVLLTYVPKTAETFVQGTLIVLICALGWGMYGAIIGGTGILSR